LEEDVEEAVALTQVKNVTIKAADGKKVTWRAPGGKNNEPLLTLSGAEGTRVEGITFDAGQRDCAVKLGERCHGLVLERVEMVNAKVAALVLHEVRGLTVHNCTLDGRAGQAAVAFTSRGSIAQSNVQPVLLDRCLIYGPAGGSAVRFDGNAAATLRRCRIFQGDFGVRFQKADRPATELQWQVTLTENTFHSQTQAAIHIDDTPAFGARKDNKLTLAQNFFAGMPVAVRLDGLPPPPPPPAVPPPVPPPAFLVAVDNSNVRKDPPGPNQPPTVPTQPATVPPVQFAVTQADVSLDPTNPAKLLTYEKGGPLSTAAANSKPAGAPPE
jgi:hypothetical protein